MPKHQALNTLNTTKTRNMNKHTFLFIATPDIKPRLLHLESFFYSQVQHLSQGRGVTRHSMFLVDPLTQAEKHIDVYIFCMYVYL